MSHPPASSSSRAAFTWYRETGLMGEGLGVVPEDGGRARAPALPSREQEMARPLGKLLVVGVIEQPREHRPVGIAAHGASLRARIPGAASCSRGGRRLTRLTAPRRARAQRAP